ncbi:hypothetical protein EJ08DRAFT_654572 [Tothia fuscella]|uniref:Sec20 C-terminal domain-containing protein n=1 Tax=Tothia fuscella TaxID=1048955 RepID=A0A9P4NE96_9PEZI|nr:hypothetical protein EJ08DRAFT_654572 [Tothia fuscella]
MSNLQSLTARLNTLSETYKATLHLINRLSKLSFQPGSTPLDTSEADVRVELTTDIHDSLKQQEEDLELLKQEIDDLSGGDSYNYQRRRESERDRDRLRLSVQVARLSEDLRLARTQFRKAQLQARHASEAAKQQERQLLLQSYNEPPSRSDTPNSSTGPFVSGQLATRRRGPEKLSEDEILVNASTDVTAALRRTQQLMQTELTRSQFAQETLDRSTAELKSLGEQYSDLDSVLGASKKLAGTLLRSNKSDTWYLQTAFWILIVTISWLVFRRLLYGPLWWLLYLPLKLSYRFLVVLFGAVGIAGSKPETGLGLGVQTGSIAASSSFPTASVGGMADSTVKMDGKESVRRGDGTILVDSDEPRNPKKRAFDTEVEAEKQKQVERKEPVVLGDGTVLEDSDEPRNPHKRMLDTEVEKEKHKDEL